MLCRVTQALWTRPWDRVEDEGTMPAAGAGYHAWRCEGQWVPTSEVGRLCYPEMGPPPQVTPPQKEF